MSLRVFFFCFFVLLPYIPSYSSELSCPTKIASRGSHESTIGASYASVHYDLDDDGYGQQSIEKMLDFLTKRKNESRNKNSLLQDRLDLMSKTQGLRRDDFLEERFKDTTLEVESLKKRILSSYSRANLGWSFVGNVVTDARVSASDFVEYGSSIAPEGVKLTLKIKNIKELESLLDLGSSSFASFSRVTFDISQVTSQGYSRDDIQKVFSLVAEKTSEIFRLGLVLGDCVLPPRTTPWYSFFPGLGSKPEQSTQYENLSAFLRSLHNLEYLDLTKLKSLDGGELLALKGLPIREIHFGPALNRDVILSEGFDVLKNLPITSATFSKFEALGLLNIRETFPGLRSLSMFFIVDNHSLSNWTLPDGSSERSKKEFFGAMPEKLTYLRLENVQAPRFIGALPSMPQLRVLVVKDKSLFSFDNVDVLTSSPLESLTLVSYGGENPMDDLVPYFGFLKRTLHSLSLQYFVLGVDSALKPFSTLTRLRELSLGLVYPTQKNVGLVDEDLVSLAELPLNRLSLARLDGVFESTEPLEYQRLRYAQNGLEGDGVSHLKNLPLLSLSLGENLSKTGKFKRKNTPTYYFSPYYKRVQLSAASVIPHLVDMKHLTQVSFFHNEDVYSTGAIKQRVQKWTKRESDRISEYYDLLRSLIDLIHRNPHLKDMLNEERFFPTTYNWGVIKFLDFYKDEYLPIHFMFKDKNYLIREYPWEKDLTFVAMVRNMRERLEGSGHDLNSDKIVTQLRQRGFGRDKELEFYFSSETTDE